MRERSPRGALAGMPPGVPLTGGFLPPGAPLPPGLGAPRMEPRLDPRLDPRLLEMSMLRRGVGPDPRRARARLAAPWANPGRGWTYQKAPPKEAQPGGQEKKEEKKEEIKAEPIDVSDVTNIVRNDYNQSFVDLGIRPQNHLRDADPATRYIEYPKLERVVQLKNEILKVRNTPAMYMQCDMKTFDFSTLGTDFDVVLMDPPWEEYAQRCEQTHVT